MSRVRYYVYGMLDDLDIYEDMLVDNNAGFIAAMLSVSIGTGLFFGSCI
jgi:hypothetical protein